MTNVMLGENLKNRKEKMFFFLKAFYKCMKFDRKKIVHTSHAAQLGHNTCVRLIAEQKT